MQRSGKTYGLSINELTYFYLAVLKPERILTFMKRVNWLVAKGV